MVELADVALILVPVAVGLVAALLAYTKFYVKVPPNQALVVYGHPRPDAGLRVITGHGFFLRPLLERYGVLSLEPVRIVAEWDLLLKDGREVRVELLCNVSVGRSKAMLDRAARAVLGKSPEEIRTLALPVLQGQARTLAVGFTFNQIKFDRTSFGTALEENGTAALASQGLEVHDLQVNEVGEPFHREEILDRLRNLTERVDALEKGRTGR